MPSQHYHRKYLKLRITNGELTIAQKV
ncbi:UNVERIFIED_CONTAM: hypothetical protein GTU68_042447 [Idotea baltica]|nr:hypothetical protein [Idotea baltica]